MHATFQPACVLGNLGGFVPPESRFFPFPVYIFLADPSALWGLLSLPTVFLVFFKEHEWKSRAENYTFLSPPQAFP